MISVIISSANDPLLKQVSDNIAATAGVPYELLSFDNKNGKRGIAACYNEGVRKASYDIICFMHEDILLKTSNWGQLVWDWFAKNPQLGLIGVAGSSYKALTPSSWFCAEIDPQPPLFNNVIQHFKHSEQPPRHDYSNPKNEKLARVACIDGVWFCTRKSIALEFPFDEKLLKGFHGYDMDFSMSVNSRYQVGVVFNVLMEHFSEGTFNRDWQKTIVSLHMKWAKQLPLNIAGLDPERIWKSEKKAFRQILRQLRNQGYSKKDLFQLIMASRASAIMKRRGLWLKLAFYLFKL